MQRSNIHRDRLFIVGLSGNGSEIGKVWNEFKKLYDKEPFKRMDENGYAIHFSDKKDMLNSNMDIHVGFSSSNEKIIGFSTIVLPATEYAVFDILAAKGYDSENEEIKKWYLHCGGAYYLPQEIGGKKFVVECYNDKFKGGDKEDSIVEIWIPIQAIYYNN
jgi:predicted transcriptional regulator YdeE